MKFFVYLLIITTWTLNVCNSESTDTDSNSTLPSTPQPGDYPYQCVLRIKPLEETFLLCECGLIGDKWCVTAAGCVDKYKSNTELLDVVCGIASTENIKSAPHAQRRNVADTYVSSLYSTSKKQSGDIALIKMTRPMKPNKYVQKAPFGETINPNTTVKLIGYGEFEYLSATEMVVSEQEKCYFPKPKDNSTLDLYCANVKNTEYDYEYTFRGPSYAGAPVVSGYDSNSKGVIVAVWSSRYETGMVSLQLHKNWIDDTMNGNK